MARKELEDWFWQVDSSLKKLADAVAQSSALNANSRCWAPRVDLVELSDRFEIRAELAGVSQSAVQVLYLPDRHTVLIRGVRDHVAAESEPIFYGAFSREIQLPDAPVEADAISSQLGNGVLCVTVPKARVRVAHTRITVRKV
ncbi:MAG: Hsp20/alpha crystallin family protein [Armatimonadetes bacterium]|nr:Hsp20/alpha crystallin family protein [Armatimonadota bacterium]